MHDPRLSELKFSADNDMNKLLTRLGNLALGADNRVLLNGGPLVPHTMLTTALQVGFVSGVCAEVHGKAMVLATMAWLPGNGFVQGDEGERGLSPAVAQDQTAFFTSVMGFFYKLKSEGVFGDEAPPTRVVATDKCAGAIAGGLAGAAKPALCGAKPLFQPLLTSLQTIAEGVTATELAAADALLRSLPLFFRGGESELCVPPHTQMPTTTTDLFMRFPDVASGRAPPLSVVPKKDVSRRSGLPL
jgi:hypothetical protein